MTDPRVANLIAAEPGGALEDHLTLLISVAQDFATSLDIEETLHHTAERMRELLDAEASSIFLLEGDELVCRACSGPIDITGLRLQVTAGIVGKTVRENTCLMVRDVSSSPDFSQSVDQSTGFVTRSILSAPLRVGEACIGALELINRQGGDGLFDHRDEQVLMALAASAALAIHNARMASALVEQERMRRELELAREIQRSLLPAPHDGRFPVAGINLPARGVSGDFFDYFKLADGRIAFNIGDVAGKGMDAALLMAKTSSLLRCLGKTLDAPGELLARVNDEVCETAARGRFVTVAAGVLDPASGRLVLASAGHPPALLRAGDASWRELPATAAPLGITPGLTFPEVELQLDGGSLYLYTDGLLEAPGAQSLGVEDLMRTVERFGHLPLAARLDAIAGAATEARGMTHDDVTLLLVERGQGGTSPADAPRVGG